jgi:hypothetical protein
MSVAPHPDTRPGIPARDPRLAYINANGFESNRKSEARIEVEEEHAFTSGSHRSR